MGKKAQALAQFLGQAAGGARAHAALALANRIVSQCEVQVRAARTRIQSAQIFESWHRATGL